MHLRRSFLLSTLALLATTTGAAQAADDAQTSAESVIVVAEGERFTAPAESGWSLTHQDHSLASQNFGGMWVTHGGLLGAAAEDSGSVAVQQVQVPASGAFRVWSKYQAPPYFNFLHRVEIRQDGKLVFAHDYGKLDAKRMYSFFSEQTYGLPPQSQVWFPWGVDHDAAEAPQKPVQLRAGTAEIRLITLDNPAPAGGRYVDFVLLTTNHENTCIGWQKGGQAKSPFIYEALRSTPIYFRFKNTTNSPARAKLFTHMGHFTWSCAPKRGVVPEQPVAPGKWSAWTNINQIVELLTDEGLQITVVPDAGAKQAAPPAAAQVEVPVEVSLDTKGSRMLGRLDVPNGETLHFPLDITWNKKRKLQLSKEIAAELIQQSQATWRKAADHKPQRIAFYGSFSRGNEPWAMRLKDALGYNTLLPDPYEHLKVDGYFQHLRNEPQIRAYAEKLGAEAKNFRVCSFGDEIHIGQINFNDPQYTEPFRAWLKQRGLTKQDLGVAPGEATLNGNQRLKWYSQLFSAEQRFAHYRHLTEVARQAFGPQVLTGANYSPHHDVMYYGNQLQWIDAFKHRAMSMFWTEDYIFFVPELPQTISFMFARMHCAVKYHGQPIHMYVMPHQPGQPADYFRRNMIYSIGAGARHIDNFWVAPAENYTENYVSWQYPETFRAIFEAIYDTAAIEPLLEGATRRPARVAIITGKATALNEDRAEVDTQADRFLKMSHLAGNPQQNICRKDQQFLYFALRHAQHEVDLITEDDIIQDDILRGYDVVYFAGEWINDRAVAKLDGWIKQGGTLVASTGLGHRNQFGEEEPALLELLGVRSAGLKKNLYHVRPLLELPLAQPVGTITMNSWPGAEGEVPSGAKIPAIAFRQALQPASADVTVLGTWEDGKAAVTLRKLGQGQAIAVGTALGATYLKTGTRPVAWARGGETNLYNPAGFDPSATRLARIGLARKEIQRQAVCSNPHVEALLLDNKAGTLLTLINWTNQKQLDELTVEIALPFKPRRVFSIAGQTPVESTYADGKLRVTTSLAAADFITVEK